jgi:hypothetical protein
MTNLHSKSSDTGVSLREARTYSHIQRLFTKIIVDVTFRVSYFQIVIILQLAWIELWDQSKFVINDVLINHLNKRRNDLMSYNEVNT